MQQRQSSHLPLLARRPCLEAGGGSALHRTNMCALLRALLAACEHRFSAVLQVQASLSLQAKPAESARKPSPWGSRAWGANPEQPPAFRRGELSLAQPREKTI